MRDLYSNVDDRLALIPAAQAASFTGTSIDLTGAKSAVFAVATGAIVGAAVFSLKLQESMDGSTWNDVVATEQQSDAPATLLTNASYRLGYLGNKKFGRLAGTLASGTSMVIGAACLIEPYKRPVA